MCMHIRSKQCKNGAADEEDPGLRPAACKVADMDAVVDAILILRRQIHSVRTDVPLLSPFYICVVKDYRL